MSGLHEDEAAEDADREEDEAPDVSEEKDALGNSDQSNDNEDQGEQGQDSSEEEEEEDNEYDLTDKFIAQEDEEDEEGDGEEGSGADRRRKRKHTHKRRREKSPELDDEDYQLLADNQVTGIRRKAKAERKRIRKQQDDQNKTEAQRLQEELFGIDDGGGLEEDGPDDRGPAADEFAISEDEMDDFIDDDDGDGRRGRARTKARRAMQGVSSHGIQEMQEVFGDVDDLLEMYAERKATAMLGREEDVDQQESMDPAIEEDPEAMAAFEERQREQKQQRRQKRMEAAIEPELMEKLMMLPLDERIRETDAPERFQLSGEADLREAYSDEQVEDAARFVLDQLIGPMEAEADGTIASAGKGQTGRHLLERGMLEVDGKPRDGRERPNKDFWLKGELIDNVTDLRRGHRGVKKPRGRSERAEWRSDPEARQGVERSIAKVLREMWNQRHEIPLIACFRKELCGELLSIREKDQPKLTDPKEVELRRKAKRPDFAVGTVQAKHRRLRRWDILWTVYDLSAKWRAMVRRKEKRTEVYQQALLRCESWMEGEGESSRLYELAEAIRSCISSTVDASNMEALDDIELKFKLVTSGIGEHFAEDLALGVRRPQRSSAYSLLKQANLEGVVRAMGMRAALFGDNLEENLKRNEVEDSRTMPDDMAYNFVTEDELFNQYDKVLERAQQVHVMEIMHEPKVRAYIRKRLDEHFITTTGPTPAGEAQLDAFHPYGCVKRLRQMPANEFKGTDLYLRIHLAEKERLVEVRRETEDVEKLFFQPMLEFYQSSGVSPVSKAWNGIRQQILREAIKKLVPQLEAEISSRLLSEAREHVLETYSEELWKYSSLPPVQMKAEDGDIVERRRLAACCWGEGRPATCLVMLDEQGSLTDILYLPSFSGQQKVIRAGVEYSIQEDPRKAADVNRIVEFCRENRPQAIFIGARNFNCKALKEDMSRIGDLILDAHAQILTSGHDTGTIEVLYSEETLAELWANSVAAREEFPDHPDVVRRAVALGRLALEPLAVLSSLCRPDGREILSLSLHPLQSHVPEGELLKAAERSVMTVVAQVGADINVMASNSWQAASLPYVAGLGPRKAQSLLQAVQAQEFALSRISLWKEIWKPGNVVFRNCGAFLKITAKAKSLVNAEVEPIDSARIEPLSYKLAFELAHNAVGSSGASQERDIIDTNKAMSRPEMVENLNLEELHDALADASGDPENYNQISTLVDIVMEFIAPNMEIRPGNLMELSVQKEKQFWWMVGESQQNLKKGRRVEAVIRYVGQNEVKCSLPEIGGLDAVLSAGDISSKGVVTPSDYLKAGGSITARIKAVRAEDFCVEITTTSSDLNDEVNWEERYSKDGNPYYHVLTLDERRAIEVEKKRLARSKELTKRTINHPNFRNVSMIEASRQLEAMSDGECIFRPHHKTTNLICLSIKIHGGGPESRLMIHKDIHEGRKRGGQLTLGTPLKIHVGSSSSRKELKFEDLDEILARFVEPLFEKFQEVVRHRKFREGSWDIIKEELRNESYRQPEGKAFAVYCLCIDYLHPGMLYIASVLNTQNRNARREFFTVLPDGFVFRQKEYKTLEKLMVVFKRNPHGSADRHPVMVNPADLVPPQLQAQTIPPQFAGFNPYQQPYPPQMQGGYVHAFEPQGVTYLPQSQQQGYR